MDLTSDQLNAEVEFGKFVESPDEKYFVIQGAAGSGKSTLIHYLIQKMESEYALMDLLLPGSSRGVRVRTELTATTNQAAAVLENLIDRPARTIHSFLRLVVKSDYKTGLQKLTRHKDFKIIQDSLIIIDEASFIDPALFKYIDAATMRCKIVLVGDYYQLAPVKQQTTIMETLKCRKTVMSKIMRNSGAIMTTGAQFRDTVETSVFDNIKPAPPALVHVKGPDFKYLVNQAFTDTDWKPTDARVLAWTNRRVHAYNKYVRDLLGYPEQLQVGETVITNKPIETSGKMISTDSIVKIHGIGEATTIHDIPGRQIQLDAGCQAFLPNDSSQAMALQKHFAKHRDWPNYFEIKNFWLDLRPLYASTVHKSQGSTFKEVFIDLSDIGRCTIGSDVARMLYVAISRASDKVILYGELPERYQGV